MKSLHKQSAVLSLLRRLLTWRYPRLLLSAVAHSTTLTAIKQYSLRAGPSAANPPAAVAAVDRRDRQTDTDGRTDARSLHRPCCAYNESSVGNNYTLISVDCEKLLEKQKNITHCTAAATPTAVTGIASYGVQGHVTPSTSNFQQHLQRTAILQHCRNINTNAHR